MNSDETRRFKAHLTANLAAVRATLATGAVASPAKQQNYKTVRTLLRSLKPPIGGGDLNVREAVALIAKAQPTPPPGLPLIVLQTEDPGPEIDVNVEIARIKTDVGHALEIRGIYVQLDCDQLKHQPKSVPIGTRDKGGGEKFGSYATKTWHEGTTMDYMATWAAGLTGLVEGKKSEHGQAKRVELADVGPVCYEGYCMLLGGKRYVSFHCYPNSR